MGLETSLGVVARLLSLENVEILGVSEEDYGEAVALAGRHRVSINDAVAYVKMKQQGIREAYSFDKHFNSLPGIRVLQE